MKVPCEKPKKKAPPLPARSLFFVLVLVLVFSVLVLVLVLDYSCFFFNFWLSLYLRYRLAGPAPRFGSFSSYI